MLQFRNCEFFSLGPDGEPILACDPFSTVKEPECLAKLHLLHLRTIARSHQATLEMYRRFAPLQEKMFRHMEREIDDAEDADRWKFQDDEADDQDQPSFS